MGMVWRDEASATQRHRGNGMAARRHYLHRKHAPTFPSTKLSPGLTLTSSAVTRWGAGSVAAAYARPQGVARRHGASAHGSSHPMWPLGGRW